MTIVRNQNKKIPNQKAPERDDVHGYWIKEIFLLHEWIFEKS